MSYTTLHLVPKEGELTSYKEFGNSYGSAFHIWNVMSLEYCGRKFDMFEPKPAAWDLFDDAKVPIFARAVLGSTFDRVMVKKKDFKRLAKYYRKFHETFKKHAEGKVCHILPIAEALEAMVAEECVACCFTQTSVSSDIWQKYDAEKDESRYYDISKDTGHWFLFDECK
jgi:hypothetical protein